MSAEKTSVEGSDSEKTDDCLELDDCAEQNNKTDAFDSQFIHLTEEKLLLHSTYEESKCLHMIKNMIDKSLQNAENHDTLQLIKNMIDESLQNAKTVNDKNNMRVSIGKMLRGYGDRLYGEHQFTNALKHFKLSRYCHNYYVTNGCIGIVYCKLATFESNSQKKHEILKHSLHYCKQAINNENYSIKIKNLIHAIKNLIPAIENANISNIGQQYDVDDTLGDYDIDTLSDYDIENSKIIVEWLEKIR
jgi:hypothetical protein